MFDENFSFGSSPPSPSQQAVEECTSADISPFTSRCSSPYRSRTPALRRDSRFDTHRHSGSSRRPSISAVTAQLQSHGLNDTEMRSPSLPPSDITSPAESTLDTDADADEGFCEGPDTPATTVSDLSYDYIDVDPTLWDLSMSDAMIATSSPRPSLSLEAQALSSYTMRRRQRQALVRLQCMVSRTPDLAMLIEECHPSSLPLETDLIRAYSKAQSESPSSVTGSGLTSGGNAGRIEKERSASMAAVRKAPRMRKRT